jgi:hypothetical protein
MRSHRNTSRLKRKIIIEGIIKRFSLYETRILKALIPDSFHHDDIFWRRAFVLKEPSGNEKGVVLLKFNETFSMLNKLYDVKKIIQDYYIVFERSYYGICAPEILQYIEHRESNFIVGASLKEDKGFLDRLNMNLIACDFASNTWVDDRKFKYRKTEKVFDAILIAVWDDIKRHSILFSAVSKINDSNYRICLIGRRWGRDRNYIEELISYYGISERVDIFEGIPQDEVNSLLNKSKVNLLLSIREGGNKSIVEGFFADVPAIVLDDVMGINRLWINESTGKISTKADLKDNLLWFRNNYSKFNPRKWAEENISCKISTAKLEQAIKRIAEKNDEPFTRGLAVKVNRPESEYYEDDINIAPFDFNKYRK